MEEMLWGKESEQPGASCPRPAALAGIQAPCGCGALDPAIIARCIASMAERCAREQAKDVDWLVAHGGFAGFPQTDLTRLQVARVFASVDFGPCDVFAQRGQNGTLHSAWRRTYTCGGSIYSGVEAVETVFDPATNLVRWNWVANEPLWAGLGACVAALL